MDAQVPQRIRYAHDDAVGTDVAEHAADGTLEEFHQCVELGRSHVLAEQPVVLGLVDRPHELRVDLEPCPERLLTPRPVAETPRIALPGRPEGHHARDPSARRTYFVSQSDQSHTDSPQSAVVRRTVRRERPAGIEISPPVAELQLRLRQAFDLYRRRHRSTLLLERREKRKRLRAEDPRWWVLPRIGNREH